MAKVPTQKEITEIQKKTESQVKSKLKEFYVDPYGPGVIPAAQWKKIKGVKNGRR